MTSEYSISVENWQDEKWEMTGREVMYSVLSDESTRQHKELKKEYGDDYDVDEKADENYPMMNYAYPLYKRPSDGQILKICEETNCTVVEDTGTGDFFLALTGGGMNLSQDIAMAYIIAGEPIPPALAMSVATQHGLSQYGKEWRKVMRECRKSLLNHAWHYRNRAKQITEALRKHRKEQEQKKTRGKKVEA